MKTLRNSMIAILAIFAVSCSTDDVENRPVVAVGNAPVLLAPEDGNAYVLSPETQDVLAERFVWTAANFGEGIIPTYEVQIDKAGNNFAAPQVVGSTSGTLEMAASNNVLNSALVALGAEPFISASFEVRIKASVDAMVVYSNAVEMIITPYTTETPRLWMQGTFQSASGYGADNATAEAPQLKAVSYGNTSFEGYVYIAADATFTLSSNASGTGTIYGAGAGAGQIADGGAPIAVTAGYYLVQADTNAGTYSLTATNWGLIGSALAAITGADGWATDLDMTYDPAAKKWTVVTPLAGGAEIKFRANDAWAVNYGDDGADGTLNAGGANIAVAASGTYTITLDLSVPRAYTYTVTAQ